MARDHEITLKFENAPTPEYLRRLLKLSASAAANQEKWHLAAILYRAIAELDLEKAIADTAPPWNAVALEKGATREVPLIRPPMRTEQPRTAHAVRPTPLHDTCLDVSDLGQPSGTEWVCGPGCPTMDG